MLLRVTPTYSFADWFVQGQVELVGTENQIDRQVFQRRRRRHGRSLAADRAVEQVGLPGRPLRGVGDLSPRHGPGPEHLRASGRHRHRRPSRPLLRPDRQSVPAGGRGRKRGAPLLSPPVPSLRGAGNGGEHSERSRGRDPPGGHPRFRLAEAQGRRGVAAHHRPGREPAEREHAKGVGGAVQFVFEPHIEFGLNAAQGTVVTIDQQGQPDKKGTFTRTSFGGFANVSNGSERYPLLFGVGGLFTRNVDQNNVAIQRRRQLLAVAELRRRPVRGLPAALHQAGGKLLAGSLPRRQHQSHDDATTTRCTASVFDFPSTSSSDQTSEKNDAQSKHPDRSDVGCARRGGPRGRERPRGSPTRRGHCSGSRRSRARPDDRRSVSGAPAAAAAAQVPDRSFVPSDGARQAHHADQRQSTQGDASFAYGVGLSASFRVIAGLSCGRRAADHLQRELQGVSRRRSAPRPRSRRPT